MPEVTDMPSNENDRGNNQRGADGEDDLTAYKRRFTHGYFSAVLAPGASTFSLASIVSKDTAPTFTGRPPDTPS